MLKGLAMTPPVIGRISIGRVVERNGKRLPEKDDEFTLTSQVQGLDGWVRHPLDAALRQDGAKLRSIPVRLVFGAPELNLRASFTLFDRSTGRPWCVGDGERCKRVTEQGIESLPCPTPAACPLGQEGRCKPYGRLHVRVMAPEVEAGAGAGAGEDDGLGTFVFRTTGFNSIRTLAARLAYFKAVSGGMLASLPLTLRLRGKSTTMSHRTPIYYVDLTTPAGMSLEQAIVQAGEEDERRKQLGFDQWALDEAAREGYAAGAFEESEEEGAAVVEEFYPDADGQETQADEASRATLEAKLERRLRRQGERVTGDP
ncbi:hydrolase or metal-binding protein [Ottowia beijingensis]|uniref:recombination directionality factor n=1 Tax=Ottowia beijingensis TaxID=1207057 RepID=UPI0036349F11